MALVCASIMVRGVESALADTAEARAQGADLVEFRIDEFVEEHAGGVSEALVGALREIVEACPLACIITCRSAEDGGACTLSASERVSLFEALTAASPKPPTYLDAEWSLFSCSSNAAQKVRLCVRHPGSVREAGTRLILSSHDQTGRPSDLSRRVREMCEERACAIVKVAHRARSLHDSLELLELPGQLARPTIALGMGEFGVMTRVLAGKFGAFLTFASLRRESATAPGQPTLRELLETYRFRQVRARTRVYGIVGWPVTHSLSPLVHNAAFGACGHDGVYLPLPIASYSDTEATYQGFRAAVLELIEHPSMDFAGASVTMPHKQNLARLAGEQCWDMDDATRAARAANTLVVERVGPSPPHVRVLNTDATAICAVLSGAFGQGSRTPAHVGVIGAGGMGRAASYAAAVFGASVTVFNRDEARAREACAQIAAVMQNSAAIRAAAIHELPKSSCDVYVQCTPLGMLGSGLERENALSLPLLPVHPRDATLIETVSRPLRTPTVRSAAGHGWNVIDGASVFVAQAIEQSRVWTSREPPHGLFERLVRGELTDA
jgi:3-dehydroquinate dehydratase/shikimate dehydrogenase